MPIRATAAAVVAVAAVITGASCGGGGGDSDESSSSERDAYVDAIASATSDPSSQTSDEARCMAEVLVDSAGVAQLREAVSLRDIRQSDQFDPAGLGLELDEAQGDAFYEGLQGCSPDLRREIVLSMVMPLGLSDAAIDCVQTGLGDDVARDLTVAIFTRGADATTDPALVGALQGVIAPCQGAPPAASAAPPAP